jgi:hypothetical protein
MIRERKKKESPGVVTSAARVVTVMTRRVEPGWADQACAPTFPRGGSEPRWSRAGGRPLLGDKAALVTAGLMVVEVLHAERRKRMGPASEAVGAA